MDLSAFRSPRRPGAILALLLGGLCLTGSPAQGHEGYLPHDRKASTLVRSTAAYPLPDVILVRSDGVKVSFPKEIDDGRPVILNFVYTTCTAVCPVMSQVFAGFQDRLGAESDRVLMISISIDPEQDTPARLAAYGRQFGAGPQWRFYTGSADSSVLVQKAFAAYRGDKMSHSPVTFLRAAPGRPWVRLDGLATPDDLAREYRRLAASG